MSRKRVLFVAEAVTLAHVARPLALAGALDPELYDITFCCDRDYERFATSPNWRFRSIYSIDRQRFLYALGRGSPVYDTTTLRRYVHDDLALIHEVRPDLIVGDFRLSLSVSARVAKIPYMTVTNAYWSPHSVPHCFPLPVLPITRTLGVDIASVLFRLAWPVASARHCMPLNRVRREHGLHALGYSLSRIYTDADHTLYADVPDLFSSQPLPPNHHYVGPILWAPPLPKPPWWESLPKNRPIVYATLGSSGDSRLLPDIIEALRGLDVTALVATASARFECTPSSNVFVADYLPGIEAARRAALVICNGGSPTTQQALAAGVPVLGICNNMDQFLNMRGIVASGAGHILRGDRADTASIRENIETLLRSPEYTSAAGRVAAIFARYSAPARFSELVELLLPGSTSTPIAC